jgi:sialidase-1
MASENNKQDKIMKNSIFPLLCLLIALTGCTITEPVQVYKSGTEGHKSYRIPAIISMPDGTLLAFAEGRVNGSDDFGDVNIVLKSSTDNGKTWSPLTTVVDYDSLQAGNPAPVADLTDPGYPDGRIFLFYNTGNNNENKIRNGKGVREVWYKTSADKGITWSDAVNITLQVHKPNQQSVNPAYNFPEDWRAYANTPGHAMQFSEGRYKGRIVVAANHTEGDPRPGWEDCFAHVFYTDDHGMSFKVGKNVPVPGGNEATAAELSGDRLMLNARNQKGNVKARIVTISEDGGDTWTKADYDKQLPDPVCEGSILTFGKYNKSNILAFCNASDTTDRNNLTLKISYDDGESWQHKILIDKSDNRSLKKSYTGYSDLAAISSGRIGILYERNDYSEIVFRIVKPKSKY